MADPDLLARFTALPFAFRDAKRLARLDRIALLLAALLGVELLELFDVGFSAFGFGLPAAAVIGFAFHWGRSVVGLFRGDGV